MQTIFRARSIVIRKIGFVTYCCFLPLSLLYRLFATLFNINKNMNNAMCCANQPNLHWSKCALFLSGVCNLRCLEFWWVNKRNRFIYNSLRHNYVSAFGGLNVNDLKNKRFQHRTKNTTLGNHLKMSGQVRS